MLIYQMSSVRRSFVRKWRILVRSPQFISSLVVGLFVVLDIVIFVLYFHAYFSFNKSMKKERINTHVFLSIPQLGLGESEILQGHVFTWHRQQGL